MNKTGFVRINRIAGNPDEGTFSPFVLDGRPICVALEPYSRDNAVGVSCINAGQYLAERYKSPKYGWVWLIRDVEGRDWVEIHWGNVMKNTKACIVLGEEFGELYGRWAVLRSKKAFYAS